AGIAFDQDGFDAAMAEQRARAQASWKGGSKATASPVYRELKRTDFVGYRQTEASGCEVLAIVRSAPVETGHAPSPGQPGDELRKGESGEIVLDHTPFYAESGGQVGDVGWLYSDDRNTLLADVTGCYAPVQGVRAHKVIARQNIRVGHKVLAAVSVGV